MPKITAPLRACIDRFEAAVDDAAFAGSYSDEAAEAVREEVKHRRKLLEAAIARNIEKARTNARL